MQLNKLSKILVGLGTLWMILYPLLFMALWLFLVVGMGFSSFITINTSQPNLPFFPLPFLTFFAIFPLHCFTILLQFVLMGFYLIHVVKNTTASESVRIILGIGCFFMPFIAMPVYYYAYIWLETPPAWALPAQAAPPA
jgi:hypothetical protein